MSATYRSRADQSAADDMHDRGRLMCAAHGCPNLWSTSDGHLCRWHADAPPHRWPEVTQDMLAHIADRAQANGFDKPRAPALTDEQKDLIMRRATAAVTRPKPNPRAWIDVLRVKQRAGIALSPMQKHCLAQVRQQEAE